ncbi:cytochrome C oxidase subunit II [Bhargavaea massiliensis]|nr:cytochrome C oxidase subunit II [Bhargavaea massiliensis]
MKNNKNPHEADLRGTLISVLVVGVLIAVMWAVIYAMYVAL